MVTIAMHQEPSQADAGLRHRWGLPALIVLSAVACAQPLADAFDLPKLVVLEIGIATAILAALERGRVDLAPLRGPIGYAACGWLLVSTIATAFSLAPMVSFTGAYLIHQGLITQVVYLLSLLLAANTVRSAAAFDRLAAGAAIAATITAAYGVLQFFGLDVLNWRPDGRAAISTFGNPNHLAEFVIMTLPFSGWWLWRSRGTWRTLMMAGIAVQGIGLIVSQARAAEVTLVLVGVLAGVMLLCARRGHRWAGWIAGVLPLVAAIAFVLVMLVAPRLFDPVDDRLDEAMPRGQPLLTRQLLWSAASRMVQDRPLFGWGLDTFRLAYPQYRMPALDLYEGGVHDADSGHNHLVVAATSAGAVGVLAFLLFHLALGGSLVRGMLRGDTASGWMRPALLVLFASWASYLLLFSTGLPRLVTDWLLWIVAGVAIGLSVRARPIRIPRLARMPMIFVALLLVLDSGSSLAAEVAYSRGRFGGEDAATRIASLEVAATLRPMQPVYWLHLAEAVARRGRDVEDVVVLQQAAAHAQRASDLYADRSAEAFALQAQALSDAYTLEDAPVSSFGQVLRLLDRAAALDPLNPLHRTASAEVALSFGNRPLARFYLAKAIPLAETPDGLQRVGEVALELDDPSTAYGALTRATTRYSRWPLRPSFYRSLGAAAFGVGRTDEAIAAYTTALRMDPGHVASRLVYARQLLEAGQVTAAAAQAQTVAERDPANAEARALMAQIEEHADTP